MKVVIVFVLALSVCVEAPTTAQATNSCRKDCRDFQRACVKAHSQAACKTDYDICMKHCKEK